MARWIFSLVMVTGLAACSAKQTEAADCKTMQAAVKLELHEVHAAMLVAGSMSMKYPIDISELEKKHRLELDPGSYDFRIAKATADEFIVEARGKGAMDGDVWRIDEKRQISAVTNKCP